MEVRAGEVYYSHRSDIEPPKAKYQLYFDDETVLLINTERSKRNISVYVKQTECPILEYDSYICVDNIFRKEKGCEIIKSQELNSETLKRIKNMIGNSTLLTNKKIEEIKRKISIILANRE